MEGVLGEPSASERTLTTSSSNPEMYPCTGIRLDAF